METRDKTQIFFRQDVPKASAVYVPHCWEDCTVLAQSQGVQVLLSVLQSVSKLNPEKATSEQRKNNHLFRSAALMC